MPTYDYKCSSCSHELEAFQNISESPLADCPNCKKKTLQRGIGGGNLLIRSKDKGARPASSCCPCGKGKCGS